MYDDPYRDLRSVEVKIRLRPDEARLLSALAEYNRSQRAVIARELLLERLHEMQQVEQNKHLAS